MTERNVVRGPNPIDVHVGSRVRLRRTLLGMSQEKLAQALDLTFQQVQKYERGLNRIGSSNLYKISQVLGVSISFFFEDMSEDLSERLIPPSPNDSFDMRQIGKRETIQLVQGFYAIKDEEMRNQIFQLMKRLGGDT
ncbi:MULTISPECIES: helix-turn-helix transcriptional regulator [unclassified Iodidimonas]|jgi:transcriptional regulator with XRE-family HTH domain|uniref:helix-turn-helix domain-containing protein n=1 Tax=unclassified Iodidimonas TaxID=2626145 RepID=UPI0024829B0B|nr:MULTISPECIES: helix-turn-helix transcriptional regulator [unclassified Iodidimonas]